MTDRERYDNDPSLLGRWSVRCVPTLSEVRQPSVNILAALNRSGKIQTGHTPRSAGMLTVLRWLITLDRNHKCVRLVDMPYILKPVNFYNGDCKELQCEACLHRERARYVARLQIFSLRTHGPVEHDFCGKRCAEQFYNNGQRPSQSRRSLTPDEDLCTIPGCQKSVYVDANGTKSKFCSNRHRA